MHDAIGFWPYVVSSVVTGAVAAFGTSLAWHLVLAKQRDWAGAAKAFVQNGPALLSKVGEVISVSGDVIRMIADKAVTHKRVTVDQNVTVRRPDGGE